MNLIKTEDLLLKTAAFEELAELNAIHKQIVEYFSFDPPRSFTAPEICLREGDLPPGGVKENYEFNTINEKGKIIGYLELYKGYPQPETAYIALLFIAKDRRKYGYGRQVVKALCEYFKEEGFSEIRLGVSLRNWPGLKFWMKCGFDQITKVVADDVFSEKGYGCLELRKAL